MLKKVTDISGFKNFNHHRMEEGARFVPKNSLVGLDKRNVMSYPFFAKVTKIEGEEVHYNIVKDGKVTPFKNSIKSFEKMFFFIDVDPSLESLLKRIKEGTLDPVKFSYGQFLEPLKVYDHHPTRYPKLDELKEKVKKGLHLINLKFVDGSNLYASTLITEEEAKIARKAIDENMSSISFQTELKSEFKGFAVDIMEYYDDTLGGRKENCWWRRFSGKTLYSFDDFKKGEFKNILKKYEDKMNEMTENEFHYKTKYHDKKLNVTGREVKVRLVKNNESVEYNWF